MARAVSGEVELEYEVIGERGPCVLLLAGLGGQLVSWDDEFCAALAGSGMRVVRFDNRDSGLSSQLDAAGIPDVLGAFFGSAPAAYTLDDMAEDAAAVLEAAGAERAHVIGISMGGMLGQLLALRHPERVATLTILMSGPAGRPTAPPRPEVVDVLLRTPPAGPAGRVEAAVELRRVLAATEHFDQGLARRRAEVQIRRAYTPAGTMRQAVAVLATENRLADLGRIRSPTLVVHGDRDPLVPLSAGLAVGMAIPGARVLVLQGVGHDLPAEAAVLALRAFHDLVESARALNHR